MLGGGEVTAANIQNMRAPCHARVTEEPPGKEEPGRSPLPSVLAAEVSGLVAAGGQAGVGVTPGARREPAAEAGKPLGDPALFDLFNNDHPQGFNGPTGFTMMQSF